MRRLLSLALAAVLAVGVGTAIVASVRERVGVGDPPPLTTVRGVIGSELELDGILQAIAKGDADHLLAHGRFLEDRFARSELDIGESGQG